jgi:metal-sulfur cluster biosynthetic enzyme
MILSEEIVREQLKKVIDPELFVNIVDLGLIYVVDVTPIPEDANRSNVHIEMTMTSPMCPAGPQLISQSKQFVSELEGVAAVDVKVVMEPPWTPDRMSDDAKDQLNIF